MKHYKRLKIKKNSDGVPDLEYYCDFEEGYIDCDKLQRDTCLDNMIKKNFTSLDTWVDGVNPYSVKYETGWLFEQLKDLGYACLEDFVNYSWFNDREEVFKRAINSSENVISYEKI